MPRLGSHRALGQATFTETVCPVTLGINNLRLRRSLYFYLGVNRTMDIYEYRIWERRHWNGHITHWSPIFAISDSEALEVVKTRVEWDALIANADTPPDVDPLDQIRSLAAHGRMDAGVYVYDHCPPLQ